MQHMAQVRFGDPTRLPAADYSQQQIGFNTMGFQRPTAGDDATFASWICCCARGPTFHPPRMVASGVDTCPLRAVDSHGKQHAQCDGGTQDTCGQPSCWCQGASVWHHRE